MPTIPVTKNQNIAVNSILELMKSNDLTLGKFVELCFSSADSAVQKAVKTFHDYGYAGKCLDIWRDQIVSKNHRQKVVPSAVSFVLKFAREEMRRIKTKAKLRNPATNLSAEGATAFSIEAIESQFKLHAPTVLRLLRGIVNRSSTFDKEALIAPVAIIGSVILKTWNKEMNYLQGMLAVYFYTQGASSSLINILQKAGVCTGPDYVMNVLKSMTRQQIDKAKAIIKKFKRSFLIVYDNINMAFRRYDQRINNKDTFENGATATLIVTSEHMTIEQTIDPAEHLQAEDLHPTKEQNKHLAMTCCFHLVQVLQRRVDESLENLIVKPVKNELPPKQTEAYPLPSMHIDQSSIEGNMDILKTIMLEVLELGEDWFENQARLIVAGDQLTLARIRSIMSLRWDDDQAFFRLQWAVPVLQLFHLQMVLASTILKTHFGSPETPGSLSYLIEDLGKSRITLEKAEFHALDEFLRHVFDALVLIIWDLEFETEDLAAKLSTYGPDLPTDIKAKVDHILKKYLTKKNHDDVGNQQSKNAALFIRDMLFYIELGSAIKAGDIGHIEETIRWLTLLFQSGGTKNYANELLRTHCAIHHSWKDQKSKNILLESMLVNTTGQPNRWIPTDLYQEHNNFLTKAVHAAKGSNLNWMIMKEKISANVRVFQDINHHVEKVFGVVHKGTTHTPADAMADINKIKILCIQAGIFKSNGKPSTKDTPPVNDLLARGLVNITSGTRIADFKKSCHRHGSKDNITERDTEREKAACPEKDKVMEEDTAMEEDEEMEETAGMEETQEVVEEEAEGAESTEVAEEQESDLVTELEYEEFVLKNYC